jgi:hypothetical protein
MSFEEILKSEFGEDNVTIDYSGQKINNIIEITILSKDGKKEFKANGLLISDEYIEIDGRKYTTEETYIKI